MAFAAGAAAVSAFAQNAFDRIPASFNIDATVLGSLASVNNETIVVALLPAWRECLHSRRGPAPASAWPFP